jgi:hypothetical protein
MSGLEDIVVSPESKPLPLSFIPGNFDVICGRGTECLNHEGNQRYRQILISNLLQYSKTQIKAEKSALILDIVKNIKCQSGRFVRKDLLTGQFFEVTDMVAVSSPKRYPTVHSSFLSSHLFVLLQRDKTSHLFRELLAKSKRTKPSKPTSNIVSNKANNKSQPAFFGPLLTMTSSGSFHPSSPPLSSMKGHVKKMAISQHHEDTQSPLSVHKTLRNIDSSSPSRVQKFPTNFPSSDKNSSFIETSMNVRDLLAPKSSIFRREYMEDDEWMHEFPNEGMKTTFCGDHGTNQEYLLSTTGLNSLTPSTSLLNICYIDNEPLNPDEIFPCADQNHDELYNFLNHWREPDPLSAPLHLSSESKHHDI